MRIESRNKKVEDKESKLSDNVKISKCEYCGELGNIETRYLPLLVRTDSNKLRLSFDLATRSIISVLGSLFIALL